MRFIKNILHFLSIFALLAACSLIKPKYCQGSIVAFDEGLENPMLIFVDLKTSSLGELPLNRQISGMALSPSGEQIVVASGSSLFLVNTQTGKMEEIISTPGDKSSPVWSPDGRYIAFASIQSSAVLSTLDLETGIITELDEGFSIIPRDWAANGAHLLLTTSSGEGPRFLALIHPDGTGREEIFQLPDLYSVRQAQLSINEEYVALEVINHEDVESSPQIILLNPETREFEKISKIPPNSFSPTWSPDGHFLAFINDMEIFVYNFESGYVTQLPLPERRYQELDWGLIP